MDERKLLCGGSECSIQTREQVIDSLKTAEAGLTSEEAAKTPRRVRPQRNS